MSETSFEQEMGVNRTAYESLREQIRRDYAGQYIALAKGQVIAASPTYQGTLAAVQRLSPLPEHVVVFPADEEPDFEPYFDY